MENGSVDKSNGFPGRSASVNRTSRLYLQLAVVVLLLVLLVYTLFNYRSLINFVGDGSNVNTVNDISDGSDNASTGETGNVQQKVVYRENPINGELIEEEKFNALVERPFLGVIIQNNVQSRPPSGLNEADVVYETLVESNITRFLAVYWSKDAERIQSIRSVRHYFVDILGDYNNPAFMHIGYASCAGLQNCDYKLDAGALMSRYGIRRLSDLRDKDTGEFSYSRDKACESIKPIEHCAYSSTQRLWKIVSQLSWKNDDLKNYRSWRFSDDGVSKDGRSLESFVIHFKSYGNSYDPSYSVKWVYDTDRDLYYRYNLDGSPYLGADGNQVYAKSVVYQMVNSYPSRDDKGRQYQEVIGEGSGYIMQGGKVYSVKWRKPDFKTKTIFYLKDDDKEFVFKRGKIWINIMPNHYDLEL